MNFVDASLVEEGGDLFIAGSGFRLKAPEAFRATLFAHRHSPVVFGIRPEDIALYDAALPDLGHTLMARAEVVETLGSEIFVHLSCASDTLVARMPVPEAPIAVGQNLRLGLNLAHSHVFDKTSAVTLV